MLQLEPDVGRNLFTYVLLKSATAEIQVNAAAHLRAKYCKYIGSKCTNIDLTTVGEDREGGWHEARVFHNPQVHQRSCGNAGGSR